MTFDDPKDVPNSQAPKLDAIEKSHPSGKGSAPLPSPSEIASAQLFQLIPAHQFTLKQLTQAYNQSRVDYMVPMPMSVSRLTEYVESYDVDLENSVVAVDGNDLLGLGLLGVRDDRTWITRLGIIPKRRRRGVGEAIFLYLLASSEQLGFDVSTLEVIRGNEPAHRLFLKWGFHETRELIILRRPPGPAPGAVIPSKYQWLDKEETLKLAKSRPQPLSWINDTPSLAHAENVVGLTVTLPDGSHGWVVFQEQKFILTRMTIGTTRGDPVIVGQALFDQLYRRYPDIDTNVENVSTTSPHLPAFLDAGFVESFRRIEMYRVTDPTLFSIARLVRGDTTALQRLLVVVHQVQEAQALESNLTCPSNCEITIATSGQEAWWLLEQQPFDMLITSYEMPSIDGITLATRARALYPRIAIVMTTARDDDSLRMYASRASIQHVLAKPVGPTEIHRVASEMLNNHQDSS